MADSKALTEKVQDEHKQYCCVKNYFFKKKKR